MGRGGGVHKTCGNSRGVGVILLFFKKWKVWEGGEDLHIILSLVGVWIFYGTTKYIQN